MPSTSTKKKRLGSATGSGAAEGGCVKIAAAAKATAAAKPKASDEKKVEDGASEGAVEEDGARMSVNVEGGAAGSGAAEKGAGGGRVVLPGPADHSFEKVRSTLHVFVYMLVYMYAAIASITTSKLVGKYRLSNFEHVRIQVFSHPADNAPEGQLAQERPICDFFEGAAFGMLNDFQINAALPICALPISSGDEYQQRRRIGAFAAGKTMHTTGTKAAGSHSSLLRSLQIAGDFWSAQTVQLTSAVDLGRHRPLPSTTGPSTTLRSTVRSSTCSVFRTGASLRRRQPSRSTRRAASLSHSG